MFNANNYELEKTLRKVSYFDKWLRMVIITLKDQIWSLPQINCHISSPSQLQSHMQKKMCYTVNIRWCKRILKISDKQKKMFNDKSMWPNKNNHCFWSDHVFFINFNYIKKINDHLKIKNIFCAFDFFQLFVSFLALYRLEKI